MARTQSATKTDTTETDSDTNAGVDTSAEVTIRLVNADTYHCHLLGDKVFNKGDKVPTSREIADKILDDTFLDSLNNEHAYWEEVDDAADAQAAKRKLRRAAQAAEGSDE